MQIYYIYICIYIYIIYIYIYIQDRWGKTKKKVRQTRPKKESKRVLKHASDEAQTTSLGREFHGCITRTEKKRERVEVRQ